METASNIWDAISILRKHPDRVVTINIGGMRAGALVRRYVRALFDHAERLGADLDLRERWGLLDSIFTVRMQGNANQLLGTLIILSKFATK